MNPMTELVFSASTEDSGIRVDRFLQARLPDHSRSAIQKWMEDGCVLVNGKSVAKNYKLSGVCEILVRIPEPQELQVRAENIPLDIVYEDDDLLVVNKPKGMVVHPAPGDVYKRQFQSRRLSFGWKRRKSF